MQKDIGDDVHSGQLVTSFQSVDKSAAVDKTTSDFDNANIKVKKLEGLSNAGFTMQILPTSSQGPRSWFFKE